MEINKSMKLYRNGIEYTAKYVVEKVTNKTWWAWMAIATEHGTFIDSTNSDRDEAIMAMYDKMNEKGFHTRP